MKRRDLLIFVTMVLPALARKAQDLKLIVKVTYRGSGTVEESHKVFIALWGTPDFVKEGSQTKPVGLKSVASKVGSVEFDDIQKSPAYVSMVYDPTGKWDAASAPPTGASLGLYMKDAAPAPITLEPGKTAKIEAEFDDSFKMK